MADQPIQLCTRATCAAVEGDNPELVGVVHAGGHRAGERFASCTGAGQCRVTVPHDCRPERDPLDGLAAAAEQYADDDEPYQWERVRAFRAGAKWAAKRSR